MKNQKDMATAPEIGTNSTVPKIHDLKKIDYSIAAVISYLADEQCVFCEYRSKCSKQRKQSAFDFAAANPGKVCSDFTISPSEFFYFIRSILARHPNLRDDAINCETTAEWD